MSPSYPEIIQKLQALANANKAKTLSQFFKTGAGDYGACDIFWGIPVPLQRPLAQEYYNLPLRDIKKLLTHPVHEVRFTGALILVNHYNRSDKQEQKNTLDFYLNNIHLFNSWDIIDLTAPKILGKYLVNNKNYNILSTLAKVNNLWAKRAAMVANLTLIKKGECGPALKLAKQYLSQKEELLHKATGWMLREIGKQNESSLLNFLDHYASQMPRIMLRYSLEKLPPELREKYLKRRYELP
ncbi:MAG TPA: DNA alkylation repair protein [bacterium]|nr:DNA alkylation repair protein [bacterium]